MVDEIFSFVKRIRRFFMKQKRRKLFLIGIATLCALMFASGIASLGAVRAGGESTAFSYETDVVAQWGE